MDNTDSRDLDLSQKLQQATDGLLFMSESDYPFEVFLWEPSVSGQITPEQVLQQTGKAIATPIQEVGFDQFWHPALKPQDWHGEPEKETIHRYQNLVGILKAYLAGLQVYRVGKVTIDVYIVGQTASGKFAGVKTKVVET
ncbi:MAG: nuclease A inhibitor family protein [Leptolyngbyaceae bacterium]|nr:nuclease A inhibitor family protein [Leptolyngbyaceae bacterium]